MYGPYSWQSPHKLRIRITARLEDLPKLLTACLTLYMATQLIQFAEPAELLVPYDTRSVLVINPSFRVAEHIVWHSLSFDIIPLLFFGVWENHIYSGKPFQICRSRRVF